ncbi:ArsR family transcriptional regulator [Nonomuraea longispora]|uniref:ArsR family transcriptional regulator n=1 Tax=Nonomuraea longispora TaxID=1848320 RepID=A0A4R4NSL5_9ACTN|nr:metalloregulator ArsR/SmtB family transcription factor [Nonomuraea longispora]TDC10222.1 ArsR family transcriptional regulator [Nonomuraea longispora]
MDDVAGAIADPVRRRIMVMLRDGRLSAGQIAERFAISRPAVSRHLRVLRESGLVRDELAGRQGQYGRPSNRLPGQYGPREPSVHRTDLEADLP